MINLNEIKRNYPASLHRFERFILKEFLQFKILEIIYNSPIGQNLVFIGGTCLRIIHENQRFSEDLDFDNFGLTVADFNQLSDHIQAELEIQGFEVSIKKVFKDTFHCHVRFPGLLLQTGLSGYKEERILIQLDTEAQGYEFTPDQHFINKFDVFTKIQTAPLSLLLAQKFHAILNRKRNKGRDFYDITFLLGLNVRPDFNFLRQKQGIENVAQLKEAILQHCKQLDMKYMADDVAPFLFHEKDVKKILLFEPFLTNKHF